MSLSYEDAFFFAIELTNSPSKEIAANFREMVAEGAMLYNSSDLLDLFLYFRTLLDYQENMLVEYNNPEYFLQWTIGSSRIPDDQQGMVISCRRVLSGNIGEVFSVVVVGRQANKVDILNRLNQIGVL